MIRFREMPRKRFTSWHVPSKIPSMLREKPLKAGGLSAFLVVREHRHAIEEELDITRIPKTSIPGGLNNSAS